VMRILVVGVLRRLKLERRMRDIEVLVEAS
jgi:hypothetical protein